MNKKILDNELDIPPEGQRSPSPEPVYDRNGIRLNTREVLCRTIALCWAGSSSHGEPAAVHGQAVGVVCCA